jgi:hypothetical protein
MRRKNFLGLGSGEAIGGAVAACGADTVPVAALPAGVVRGWNALALQAIHDIQPDPATAAQALAILHTCMYNAWAAYDDAARQTTHGRAVRLPRAERSAASKASAMSHAAYLVLCDRFPSHAAGFGARMADLGLDPAPQDAPFTPAGIGHNQASAMLDGCRDNAGQPFALPAPDHGQPAPPADPAHWCRLTHQLSERGGHDEDRDVLLYFVLANALADAAIAQADAGAAAAVVLRSFSGSYAEVGGQALGREIGARVFEKARRYWQGKL